MINSDLNKYLYFNFLIFLSKINIIKNNYIFDKNKLFRI